MSPRSASGWLYRWAVPLGLVWAQLLLSAFVFERRLPPAVRSHPSGGLQALLLSLPIFSFGVLLLFRRLDRSPENQSRTGNALLVWLLGFFLGAHILGLLAASGAIRSLSPGLPLATGVLLLGLAVLLPSLPPGCPFGLSTSATRKSDAAWRTVHRKLALAFAASGCLAVIFAFLIPGPLGSALALLPASLVMARGLLWKGG